MKFYLKYIKYLLIVSIIVPIHLCAQSFTDITQLWLDRGSDRIRIQPEDQFVDGEYKYLVIDAGILSKGAKLMHNETVVYVFKSEEVFDDQKSRSKLVIILDEKNKYVENKIFYINKLLDIVKIKYRENSYFISTIGPIFEATIEQYNSEGKFIKTIASFDASYRVNLTDFDIKNSAIVFSGFFDQRAYIVFKTDTIKQEFQNFNANPVPWFPVGFIISMNIETEQINYSKGFGCQNAANNVTSVTLDNDSNAIIVGTYDGVNFNFFGDTLPYRGGFGASEAYIAKISQEGKKQWHHSFSSNSFMDRVNGVLLDEYNNVFASSISRDEGKFYLDDLEFNKNSYGYMMKFLAKGKIEWVKEFKGPAFDIIPLCIKDDVVFFGCSYYTSSPFTLLDNMEIKHKSNEGIVIIFKLEEDSGKPINEVGIVSNGKRIDLIAAMNTPANNTVLLYNNKNNMDLNGTYVKQVEGFEYINVLANIEITTNIKEQISKNEITIFPSILSNKDQLVFNSYSQDIYNYEIYNPEGIVLINNVVSANSNIDVSILQNGLYIIKFKNKNQIFSKRFFIQN